MPKRESRNLNAWPKPHYYFETFDSFITSPMQGSGLYTIKDGEFFIDFYFKDENANRLSVFFHGAISPDIVDTVELPIFSGMNIGLGLKCDRLLFSDATLSVDKEMIIGWFSGTRSYNFSSKINDIIFKVHTFKNYIKTVLLGGSQGGFAAMRASRHIPDSLALVWNPQTIVDSYSLQQTRKLARLAYNVSDISKIPESIHRERGFNLINYYSGEHIKNYVFYMQNVDDPIHVENHAIPFFFGLTGSDPLLKLGVNRITSNILCALGDWTGGHSRPDKPSVAAIFRYVMSSKLSFGDLFERANFETELPDSFFRNEKLFSSDSGAASSTGITSVIKLHSPVLGAPHMTGEERTFFESALESAKKHWYLEYGAGGSTRVAIRKGFKHITSVDSDEKWASMIRRSPEASSGESKRKFIVQYADIGPVGKWGKPLDRSGVRRWPNYVLKPWYVPPEKQLIPSCIFIDGRFRAACSLFLAIQIRLLRCKVSPTILIHDLTDDRPYYAVISKYYDSVRSVGSLHILEMKKDARLDRLLADYSVHLMNPD